MYAHNCLSVYIYSSIHLSVYLIYLSVYIYSTIHLSVSLSIHFFFSLCPLMHPHIHPSIHLSVYLSVILSIYSFSCLSAHLSVIYTCLWVCTTLSLSLWIHAWMNTSHGLDCMVRDCSSFERPSVVRAVAACVHIRQIPTNHIWSSLSIQQRLQLEQAKLGCTQNPWQPRTL